jgi:hypothetical protein
VDAVGVYRRPEHVAYVVEGGETVLLHMESGAYVGLSAHATRIWELVLAHGAPDAVVTALAAEFPGTPADVLRGDVHALLDRLVAADLLDRVED